MKIRVWIDSLQPWFESIVQKLKFDLLWRLIRYPWTMIWFIDSWVKIDSNHHKFDSNHSSKEKIGSKWIKSIGSLQTMNWINELLFGSLILRWWLIQIIINLIQIIVPKEKWDQNKSNQLALYKQWIESKWFDHFFFCKISI